MQGVWWGTYKQRNLQITTRSCFKIKKHEIQSLLAYLHNSEQRSKQTKALQPVKVFTTKVCSQAAVLADSKQ